MILYEMLVNTTFFQKVAIFETNVYCQFMPLFIGTIQEARADTETVWWWLTKTVDRYEYEEETKTLIIHVKDEHYEEKLEEHYIFSEKWNNDNRPWIHGFEIYKYVRLKGELQNDK